jgi:hypothetical protein
MQQLRKIEDGFHIGPQPAGEDLEEAGRRGVKTVIDFRLPTETLASGEDLARSCGLDDANIPVDKTHLKRADREAGSGPGAEAGTVPDSLRKWRKSRKSHHAARPEQGQTASVECRAHLRGSQDHGLRFARFPGFLGFVNATAGK